jgi:hypothetical protein
VSALTARADVSELRRRIATGETDTPATRRLVLRIGNAIPDNPDRDRLREELQTCLEMLGLAGAIGLEDPDVERDAVMRAIERIEQHFP